MSEILLTVNQRLVLLILCVLNAWQPANLPQFLADLPKKEIKIIAMQLELRRALPAWYPIFS